MIQLNYVCLRSLARHMCVVDHLENGARIKRAKCFTENCPDLYCYVSGVLKKGMKYTQKVFQATERSAKSSMKTYYIFTKYSFGPILHAYTANIQLFSWWL